LGTTNLPPQRLPLDGCADHREGVAEAEKHAFSARLVDRGEAMLVGPRHLRDEGGALAGSRSRWRGRAAGPPL